MNSSRDNQLNRLLEDWADKSATSAEDLTALRQRVVEQLDNDSAVAVELPSSSTSTRPFVAAGLAAAAVLLVSVGVWRYYHDPRPTGNQAQIAVVPKGYPLAGSFQEYWPKHLIRQRRLLSEYHILFGSSVSWVTETEKSCEVGLVSTGARDVDPSEFIVIQLWLVARDQQDGHSEVRSISVLAGREELIEIPAAIGGGPLALWAYPIDEETISIDLRYQPSSVAGVEINDSKLQRVGRVTNIHSFEQDGIEYQLYLTADLLDANDRG